MSKYYETVKSLNHGESCIILWSEGGGGEVYRLADTLFLFEIPQYGGDGWFAESFHVTEIDKLIDLVKTWT